MVCSSIGLVCLPDHPSLELMFLQYYQVIFSALQGQFVLELHTFLYDRVPATEMGPLSSGGILPVRQRPISCGNSNGFSWSPHMFEWQDQSLEPKYVLQIFAKLRGTHNSGWSHLSIVSPGISLACRATSLISHQSSRGKIFRAPSRT